MGRGLFAFLAIELFIAIAPIISSGAALGKAVPANGFSPSSDLQQKAPWL
jgi:hypothetical protein